MPTECFDGYPRHYVVRRLTSFESSQMALDGSLDESSWQSAAWTDSFQDIQGDAIAPSPYLDTKVKLLWDDNCLYVGAAMEEPQAWAEATVNNSLLFQENDFEVFADPDGCDHKYTELEINALGTQWNLLMVRPYIDGGPNVCRNITPGECATSSPEHGVLETWDVAEHLNYGIAVNGGAVNNPELGSKSWNVELCVPIKQYLQYSSRKTVTEGDYWRFNMLRVEWHLHVEKKQGSFVYVKDQGKPSENWAWQPTGVVNIHMPNRWGIIQFAGESSSMTAVRDKLWPLRNALAQVYEAEHIYAGLFGKGYTDDVAALVANAHLDEALGYGKSLCVAGQPVVHLKENGFVVDIKYVDEQENINVVGHITHDRFISFS